jgi:hypothetical protein
MLITELSNLNKDGPCFIGSYCRALNKCTDLMGVAVPVIRELSHSLAEIWGKGNVELVVSRKNYHDAPERRHTLFIKIIEMERSDQPPLSSFLFL